MRVSATCLAILCGGLCVTAAQASVAISVGALKTWDGSPAEAWDASFLVDLTPYDDWMVSKANGQINSHIHGYDHFGVAYEKNHATYLTLVTLLNAYDPIHDAPHVAAGSQAVTDRDARTYTSWAAEDESSGVAGTQWQGVSWSMPKVETPEVLPVVEFRLENLVSGGEYQLHYFYHHGAGAHSTQWTFEHYRADGTLRARAPLAVASTEYTLYRMDLVLGIDVLSGDYAVMRLTGSHPAFHAVALTIVPEPMSLALLLVLTGVGPMWMRRRG